MYLNKNFQSAFNEGPNQHTFDFFFQSALLILISTHFEKKIKKQMLHENFSCIKFLKIIIVFFKK